MRRFALAVAGIALAFGLAGCPLPQPLPSLASGSATPPRILADGVTVNGVPQAGKPVFLVPAGCATGPAYALDATLSDNDTVRLVDARWFVNYRPTQGEGRWIREDLVPASADATVLTRPVPTFTFLPYENAPGPGSTTVDRTAPGALHVVELVVSSQFFDPPEGATPPWRGPGAGFETSVYRWTFLTTPEGSADTPCP